MTEHTLDLSPAKWIWAPCERTLPNTFVCFRVNIPIDGKIRSAVGHILASSRYLLSLNGCRVQWGPAPADPRYEEADPLDLTDRLQQGDNVLGIRVCYFGYGDGTWVAGRPGLLFRLDITYADGRRQQIISDRHTHAWIDASHPAGQYKRWLLRALQEEYDARRDAVGFDTPVFVHPEWFEPARELPGTADKPSCLNGAGDYLFDTSAADSAAACIRARTIPLLNETFLPAKSLYHFGRVTWKRSPDDWFRFRVSDAFTIREGGLTLTCREDRFTFDMPDNGDAVCLTFVMPEQGCGFIDFGIDAPEGTIIEAMVQESHDKAKTLWLDTGFYSWTRFICREGFNHFVSFDSESFMYLQLHIRGAAGTITVIRPGMLRRTYPTGQTPQLHTDNPRLQKLFSAGLNTLRNSALETFTDGMARERQQYTGDGCHEVTAFSYLYGFDDPLVRRFFETVSDGQTVEGYYLDCWPACDRMQRIPQAQLGMTVWAPILDHAFQLILEVRRYAFHTGDRSIAEKCLPGFLRFYHYLCGRMADDGLLPVEHLRNVSVWIDHTTFHRQRDKRCVFNLYFAAAMEHGLAPLCEMFGEDGQAEALRRTAADIVRRVTARYYSPAHGLFIDNLPYAEEDGGISTSDRTLATALLYDYCPDSPQNSVDALANPPAFLGKSYPNNMVWAYQALAKYRRTDAILRELKTLWYPMLSVQKNNTIQETFEVVSDSCCEMSHCALSPLLAPYEYFGGLRCEAEAFSAFSLSPCLGGLRELSFTARTSSGDIRFEASGGRWKAIFDEQRTKGFRRQPDSTLIPLASGQEIALTD